MQPRVPGVPRQVSLQIQCPCAARGCQGAGTKKFTAMIPPKFIRTPASPGGVEGRANLFSPATVPKGAALPQQCVFIDNGASGLLCLGRIGACSSRFCITNKLSGVTHCGTRTHVKNRLKSNKFAPDANNFYAPGGMVGGKPTVLMDPHIVLAKGPRHLQTRFLEGLLSSKQWVHETIEALTYVPRMKFKTPKGGEYSGEGGDFLEDNTESVAFYDAWYIEEPDPDLTRWT